MLSTVNQFFPFWFLVKTILLQQLNQEYKNKGLYIKHKRLRYKVTLQYLFWKKTMYVEIQDDEIISYNSVVFK